MKIIANVEKKTLRILENERSIFRGEYGADKLELYINKQLENEYPTITALLSNGRKIGPYSTDEAYTTEIIDNVTYTKANFTLSKANGFTLSEGKMMITIWMNSNGKQEALGNITLNVINTTAFDDGDIIISGDVEGTIVNIKVELENLQSQVNTFNGRITNLEAKKFIDLGTITQAPYEIENDILNNTINFGTYTFKYSDNQYIMLISQGKSLGSRPGIMVDVIHQIIIPAMFTTQKQCIHRYKRGSSGEWTIERFDIATTDYVDKKIADLINGAPETLDTLFEIANALQDDDNAISGLITELSKKANKSDIPTKLSQLEQDIAVGEGVSEEQVMEIIEENSEQVGEYDIGPSDGYDWNSDTEIPTCKAVTEMINNDKRMQEMIVDIVWDENDEAFIELGKNIIDWSRPVFFELYIQNGKDSFVLEWNIYEQAIRYYPFSFTISKDDYSLIVNGLGFYSSGSKSRIGSHLDDHYYPSYIYFCDTGDVQYILNYNKMKVYYYPVNENSPTTNKEI